MSYDPYRKAAALMLAQGWDRALMTAAMVVICDGHAAQARAIVRDAMAAWPHAYAPGEQALAEILRSDCRWDVQMAEMDPVTAPPQVRPLPAFAALDLPRLTCEADLAAWLSIPPATLSWLADCDGRHARGPGGHYTQTWLRKRSGALRLVEAPRPRLKAVQRQVLRGILDMIPPHPDSFGFVAGRNCQQGAARHAGEAVVIGVDLADFFPSVPSSRVHAIFRCLGYSPALARVLTGLVTTRTPSDALAVLPAARRAGFGIAHLPQGAPTSPALANLAAWRLDRRMAGLAQRMGAHYSRYADDLTLSGDRGLGFEGAHPVLEQIAEIVTECGFRLNPAKTRVMKQGQRQEVTGLIVNRHLNIRRAVFDQMKAILTNCVRHGPKGQNRTGHPAFREHLDGRVTWVETVHPGRGQRLRALFGQIDWSA